MKKALIGLVFLLVIVPSMKGQDYAASVKASSLGIHLEAIRSFTPRFNARVGFAFLSYTANSVVKSDAYNADGNLDLKSITAMGDWFPFKNSWRLTAGVLVNPNKASLSLVPLKTYTTGNLVYTPEKLGRLNADLTFNKIAPYLGLGIGNPTAGGSGFGVTFDLGTFYQGAPKASMTATKLLGPSASQSGILQDNLSWFKFYPVMSVGLTYKF